MSNKSELIDNILEYGNHWGTNPDRKLLEQKSVSELQHVLLDAANRYRTEVEDQNIQIRAEAEAKKTIAQLELQESRRPEHEAKQRQQLESDKKTFASAARTLRSFGQTEANLNLIRQVIGSGFTVSDIRQALAAGQISLSRATLQEIQQWAREDIDTRNEYLQTADTQTLRQEAKAEAAQNRQTAAQTAFERELEAGLTRDITIGGMPPLPATWNGEILDKNFIRKASTETLKTIMRKYGSAQLNARLHDITKVGNFALRQK